MSEEPREADIRASDAEREHVVERLREAGAEARLTLEELVERSGAAYSAQTRGELERLTRDLPSAASADSPPTAPSARRRPSRWIVSIMGGTNRRGRWRPAERITVVDIMGGSTVDLRQAEVSSRDITITAVMVMGGTDVIVPEGVEVDLNGFGFMGGHDENLANVPPRPGTPLVRINAFAFMGGLTVRSKSPCSETDPGDSAQVPENVWDRQERARRRADERRELRQRVHEDRRQARRFRHEPGTKHRHGSEVDT